VIHKKPQVIPMILEQVEKETEDEWRPKRVIGSFRGSELGDCPRYIQYELRGFEKEPVSPELGLLFRDGHLHHDALRKELSAVGRVTNREFSVWKHFTREVNKSSVDFVITGTLDGIFNGEYPFDIKSINPFSFKHLSKEYIWEKYRGYVYQIQIYLELTDKEWGFLLFKDKAFSALKIFWYRRDPKILNMILDKMSKIHLATIQDKWIKRPFTRSSTECERCPMRQHCWGRSMKRREWR
jgi:hypothetical protein